MVLGLWGDIKESAILIINDNNIKGSKYFIFGKYDTVQVESTNIEFLELPDEFNGSLVFSNLESAIGLTLPKVFRGNLMFCKLENATGIKWPEVFIGKLIIQTPKIPEGLLLPDLPNVDIKFNKITSVDGLNCSCRCLSIDSVTSLKGLNATFRGLSAASVVEACDFAFPQTMQYLMLAGLKTANGLLLPQKIEGVLQLGEEVPLEEIELPENFECDDIWYYGGCDAEELKQIIKESKGNSLVHKKTIN